MEGFALELEDELMNFSDVSYKSFVKSESEIITLFYDKFADIPLPRGWMRWRKRLLTRSRRC